MFYRTLALAVLILATILNSCGQQEEKNDNPAQKQIDEYTKEAKDLTDTNSKETVISDSNFVVLPTDIVLGDPTSYVVVVEYFAPTCNHCANYHKFIFPELKAKYIDNKKIAYIFREFIGSKQDLDASILMRCKGDLDSYLKFSDVLLSKIDSWAYSKNYREILTNIASLGGIAPETLVKCLDDQDKVKILWDNTKIASKIPGFWGTPTFIINGKIFDGKYTVTEMSKVIDELFAKEKKP